LPAGQAGGLVNNIAGILQLLGGTQTTQTGNPGDTAALRATLGQLQGADYQAMLQAIFQQAGGQIPGIQQAMGNAIGARSGGNSAVAAALQKLLQQTTIAGQEQIAKQQLANQQTQVQAGQAIAQATKGTQTTQQTGTNLGQGLTTAAKLTAGATALQALLKLTGQGTIQDAAKRLAGMGSTNYTDSAGNYVAPNTVGDQEFMNFMTQSAAPMTSAAAPQMSMAPQAGGMDINALLAGSAAGAPAAPMPAISNSGPQMSMADPSMFAPRLDINSIIGNTQPAPEMSMAPPEMFAPAFNINDFLGGSGGASFTPDANAYAFGSNWWE
jgi:hypothetical protein